MLLPELLPGTTGSNGYDNRKKTVNIDINVGFKRLSNGVLCISHDDKIFQKVAVGDYHPKNQKGPGRVKKGEEKQAKKGGGSKTTGCSSGSCSRACLGKPNRYIAQNAAGGVVSTRSRDISTGGSGS